MNIKRFFPVAVVLASAFVAGVLFATLGANLFNQGDRVGTDLRADTPDITRGSTIDADLTLEEAFISVAAAVNPTVVQVLAQQDTELSPSINRLFDIAPEYMLPRQGLGSGVIVRSDGYIVTNYHVIADATKLQVMLQDGSIEAASVVGSDSNSDLAVIKIDKEDLPTIPFGAVEDIRAGQWVLAFGSPLSQSLENTVTAGIVSAVGRTSTQLSSMNLFAAFIQTDAAINRGNSGGPLVNLRGELIGINTAIMSPTGINSGIGFALPVDAVENVVTQLLEKGRVDRGYLGVRFDALSPALVQALNLPPGSAQITAVIPGGPADEAGLETGQIITKVNGQVLTDANHLRVMIGNMNPGAKVELEVVEGEDTRTHTIQLGLLDPALYAQRGDDTNTEEPSEDSLEEHGLTLSTFNANEFAQQAELDATPEFEGVIVEGIDPAGSAYGDSDLRQGDIIVEINRESISNLRDFQRVYNRLDAGSVGIVKLYRLVSTGGEEKEFIVLMTALTRPEQG